MLLCPKARKNRECWRLSESDRSETRRNLSNAREATYYDRRATKSHRIEYTMGLGDKRKSPDAHRCRSEESLDRCEHRTICSNYNCRPDIYPRFRPSRRMSTAYRGCFASSPPV